MDERRGRSRQSFLVETIVRAGSDTRRAVARGVDSYAVTAPLVCGAVRHGGAFAPGELFDADDFLSGPRNRQPPRAGDDGAA